MSLVWKEWITKLRIAQNNASQMKRHQKQHQPRKKKPMQICSNYQHEQFFSVELDNYLMTILDQLYTFRYPIADLDDQVLIYYILDKIYVSQFNHVEIVCVFFIRVATRCA